MIGRGQLFVRAQDPRGKWHSADIFDLDAESFRAWIVYQVMLCRHGSGLPSKHDYNHTVTLRTHTFAPTETPK